MLKTVVSKADLHDMVKATQQTSTASVKGIPSLQLDLAAANTTTLSNNNKNTPSYTARASRQSTARPSSSNRRVQRSGSMAVIKSSALRRQRPQSATVRSTSSSRASTPASNASSLGLRAGATTRNQKPKRLLSASAQARRERMKHYDELRASQSREKHFSKLSAQQHAKQKKVNQRLLQANNRTFASTLTVTNSRPKLAPPLLSPPATADSALTSSSTASSANNSVRNSSSGKRRATMIGAGNWVEDASKTLDQLANAALVAVAREKQQIVTRANKKVAKDDDIEGDLMMRSFDQREIDRRQQEDVERHEREKHAAVILRQQIADRVQAREQAEQQRLNERNLINERHRRLQEEEERERQNKLKRAVQLQQQQVESNQVLMQAKTQKRQEEMLEDLRNAEYLIELAAKKQAEEDERLRRQKARDDECFRLRAMQQRVIDR